MGLFILRIWCAFILLCSLTLTPSWSRAWSPESFKKPTREELKSKLTKDQFRITQEDGTERPFKNAYHDHKQEGIYVDVVSGEPLFSSNDKYDSRTGWPSFTKPIVKANVIEKPDNTLFMKRTEVRSKHADSHLGHVFPDGPAPTGLRYCMNSAALRFIPKNQLHAEGYGEFAAEFGTQSEIAILAGGCFWCMEKPFDDLPGVISTRSGFSGGDKTKTTYKEVSAGGTGHREVVEVSYDPAVVSFEKILEVYWRNIDPHDSAGQFCDKGDHYKSAVYFTSEKQKQIFEESKKKLDTSKILKSPIVTELIKFDSFHVAEDSHQDYYKRNPIRYSYYRKGCGRDKRLQEIWGNSHQ